MTWIDYIIEIAAPHSKYNGKHWFRYLSKDIGREITPEEIEVLYDSDELTAFQKVTLKYAFTAGSSTHEHIIRLNQKVIPNKLQMVRDKYGNKF